MSQGADGSLASVGKQSQLLLLVSVDLKLAVVVEGLPPCPCRLWMLRGEAEHGTTSVCLSAL